MRVQSCVFVLRRHRITTRPTDAIACRLMNITHLRRAISTDSSGKEPAHSRSVNLGRPGAIVGYKASTLMTDGAMVYEKIGEAFLAHGIDFRYNNRPDW